MTAKLALAAALAEVIAATPSQSPKQYLVLLRERTHLNPTQLRSLAGRLDELIEAGEKGMDALHTVVKEYDKGDLRIEGGGEARAVRPPGVFDAASGDSAKQVLVWLHERGTLSLREVQTAAQALSKEPDLGDWDRDDMAEFLYELKFYNALPEGWKPGEPFVPRLTVLPSPPRTPVVRMTRAQAAKKAQEERKRREAEAETTLRDKLSKLGLEGVQVDAVVEAADGIVEKLSAGADADIQALVTRVLGEHTVGEVESPPADDALGALLDPPVPPPAQ